MPRLLLVDDDPYLLRALEKLFGANGCYCRTAASGEQLRCVLEDAAHSEPFDLIVLDVRLPDTDGFTLCRHIRRRYQVPILMLTARSETADKVAGLEVGADDYLTKPFDPAELLARARALMRRATEYNPLEPSTSEKKERGIVVGPLVIDPEARQVYRNGAPLSLTEREFQLLHLLAQHAGRALSSAWIFETLWGCDAALGSKTLTVHVQRLRQKIEAPGQEPQLLLTVRGFGYKLVPPEPS